MRQEKPVTRERLILPGSYRPEADLRSNGPGPFRLLNGTGSPAKPLGHKIKHSGSLPTGSMVSSKLMGLVDVTPGLPAKPD